MNQGPATTSDHYLEDPTTSAASGSLASASSPPSSFNTPSPMLYNMDELLRMKRKEKHMAPIDCSGVTNQYFSINKVICQVKMAGLSVTKKNCAYYLYTHCIDIFF